VVVVLVGKGKGPLGEVEGLEGLRVSSLPSAADEGLRVLCCVLRVCVCVCVVGKEGRGLSFAMSTVTGGYGYGGGGGGYSYGGGAGGGATTYYAPYVPKGGPSRVWFHLLSASPSLSLTLLPPSSPLL
jgi:hypothetical protein